MAQIRDIPGNPGRVATLCEQWLLEVNVSKCKTVSYCMKNMTDIEYFTNAGCTDHDTEKLTNIKDLVLVSTSRSRSRLEKNCQRLGLGHLRLVAKTNFWPNCAGHSTQCEWPLDVVSLCCSYYCSSY